MQICAFNAHQTYDETNKKQKLEQIIQWLFLEELGLALVSHQLDSRSKNINSKFLNVDIQNALAAVGYPVSKTSISNIDPNSIQTKRKRYTFCERSTEKKTSTQCCSCAEFICNEHSVKRIFVQAGVNKEYHINNIFSNWIEQDIFIKRLIIKYEKKK